MNVRNCRKCKRIFNYLTGPQLCPSCKEELENKFQEVKKYLFNNRNATVSDVVQNCDVDDRQVREWIREERLEFSSGINAGVTCENCGDPITTGRFCAKCKASIMNDLGSVARPVENKAPVVEKASHKNKMRFINNDTLRR